MLGRLRGSGMVSKVTLYQYHAQVLSNLKISEELLGIIEYDIRDLGQKEYEMTKYSTAVPQAKTGFKIDTKL